AIALLASLVQALAARATLTTGMRLRIVAALPWTTRATTATTVLVGIAASSVARALRVGIAVFMRSAVGRFRQSTAFSLLAFLTLQLLFAFKQHLARIAVQDYGML